MAYVDSCWFIAGSSGTADFADGTALAGFRNLSGAGAADAAVYSYRAESLDRTEWENGYGVYASAGGGTLARTVTASSAGGTTKVDFSAPPILSLQPLKTDLNDLATKANGAIQSSLLTTRGDIIFRDASAPARLARGTQYQVLQAGANDPAYGAVNLAQAAAVTGVLPAANLPDASQTAEGVVELATAAEYRTGTDAARALVVDQVWAAAALAVLTDGTNIAVDFAAGFNFGASSNAVLGLGGNRTLSAPSNLKNGQAGVLWFGAVTSTRTLTLNAAWLLLDGVEAGPYSITTAQELGIAYVIRASRTYVTSIMRRAA